jgi:serine/threonine protein kinase
MGEGPQAGMGVAGKAGATRSPKHSQSQAAQAIRPASRYRSDFRDEQRLGKGGFGVVVSVINQLDGLKYAVKKIPLAGEGVQ